MTFRTPEAVRTPDFAPYASSPDYANNAVNTVKDFFRQHVTLKRVAVVAVAILCVCTAPITAISCFAAGYIITKLLPTGVSKLTNSVEERLNKLSNTGKVIVGIVGTGLAITICPWALVVGGFSGVLASKICQHRNPQPCFY